MSRIGLFREHSHSLYYLLRFVDIVLLVLAAYLSFSLYIKGILNSADGFAGYRDPVAISVLFALITFPAVGLYGTWRGLSLTREIRAISIALAIIFLGLAVLSVVTKTSAYYSRMWAGLWLVFSWLLLVGCHSLARGFLRWMRSLGLNYRNIVIVGSGDILATVANQLMEASWAGFHIVAIFGPRDSTLPKLVSKQVYYTDKTKELAVFVRENNVDQVWIATPLSGEQCIEEVMSELHYSSVDIRYIPDIFGFRLLNHSITEVAGLPVVNLSVTPMDGVSRWVKMLEDRFLAFLILLLTSPLMLLIALFIKLDSPGPVIFKQFRHGWDGKLINVYKFRTMNRHDEKCGQVTQARKDDNRVTKFGRFLRRTSLDELPQFYNVLQGRMSIVGPRPHAIEHNQEYMHKIDGYMLRHKVKPGITGWAQVNGFRGQTDTLDKMRKRVEFDLFYIENWSLWFDIKIIVMTLFKGFMHKNAY